ncbi:fatty acid transporter protein [Rhypophila decipiens]
MAALSASTATAAAAALIPSLAYLRARLSLPEDGLFFSILGRSILHLVRSVRANKTNLFYMLEDHARNPKFANRTFLLFEDQRWTYAETYAMALRYGTYLKKVHGVKEKDVVALDCQNSDLFVFCWFGMWSIGATPAFINHHLTNTPLAHSLRSSTAKLVLVDPGVQDTLTDEVRAGVPNMDFVVLESGLRTKIETMADPVRYPDGVRNVERYVGMAILIYTSGTTGLPKPAVVSWAKIYTAAHMTGYGTNLTPDDVFYTAMPLYHSSAACLGLSAALFAGCTAAIGRKFSTTHFWSEIRRHEATVFQYVGETCRYLTFAPQEIDPVTGESMDRKHKVRAVCGNGLRPDVWDKFKDRFGIDTIFEFYAATEGAVGFWNRSQNDFSKGALGRYGFFSSLFLKSPVAGRIAIIRMDPETDEPWRDPTTGFCARVKTNEAGEMLARLPEKDIALRFQGYFANDDATNSKIMRDVFRKGDAWFRSGDMIRWDEHNRVYFSDRLGDTFRWKSENVSTAEVSEVLGNHASVQEANVYGVQLPNHDGRAGCVAIVFSTPEPTREMLKGLADHALAILPRYAVPLFLRLRKEVGLHNTGTNKQQKHVLRSESVDPNKVGGDTLFWLKDGTYVPFGEREWNELEGGRVKL